MSPSRIAEWLIFATIVAIGVLGVFVARGLYGDGSLFLLNILRNEGFWDYDPARSFAQLVTQSPVVLAVRLGARDLDTLVHVHSLGLVALPLLAWLLAFLLALRTPLFWFIALAFSVSYLTTGFFPIGEFNLTYALSALCCVLLLRAKPGIGATIALVLCAFALMRAYEAMVFLGPLLFALSIRRLFDDETRRRPFSVVAVVVASFLFCAASALAAWSILNPRDPGNLADAMNVAQVIGSPHFVFVALMLLVYAVLYFVHRPALRTFLALPAVVGSIAYLANADLWPAPQMHYSFRSVAGLLLFSVLSMTAIASLSRGCDRTRQRTFSPVPPSCAVVAFSLFIGLGIPMLVATFRFGEWIREFESAAVSVERWTPIDETPVYRGGGFHDGFSWRWANPSLSLILRGNSDAGLLNHSGYEGWQPFEPERMSGNPLANYSRSAGSAR